MRPRNALFLAEWLDAAFVHFRIDPDLLQPMIPLPLDCYDGHAYVSLVAFTQKNLRPTIGGALAAWLATPLSTHEFLNVRTYVRHNNTRGIFFLTEWIPNRLACLIGPRTYGLPYRLGKLDYQPLARRVTDQFCNLKFQISDSTAEPQCCAPNTLDHFLLERYTAFTHRAGVIRRFDVDHVPWPIREVTATIDEASLLPLSGDWHRHAHLATAHASPGVHDVAISAPGIVGLADTPASPARRPRGGRCASVRPPIPRRAASNSTARGMGD
jgi:uncharacterized protein YqjF (DUF2071 family)